MPETPFSFSQVESPASGSTLPSGWHVIRGWVWPKAGGHFTDVRARLGEHLFPGVHGLPRADLAAHFSTGRPVALAAFEIEVALPAGTSELRLEVLTIEGRWQVFQSLALNVTMAGNPPLAARDESPLRWIDYGYGLRRLMHAARRQPDRPLAALASEIVTQLPRPRVLREVPAPLRGFVDEPASACGCHFGRIPAFGHLFHPSLRTRRVLATVDLQSWQPLAIEQPSPGPAAHYAAIPNAHACGFVGLVDVPAQLPNPVSLRIYAELEDGSLHLGPVVRTRLHDDDEEKAPPHPPTQPFDAVISAWDEALRDQHLEVTRDQALVGYVRRLEVEHAAGRQAKPTNVSAPLIETRAQAAAAAPRRVLLATHGLDLQGAPRFLLDLARTLREAGTQIDVVSAADGPLRPAFTALGATVNVIDVGPVLTAPSHAALGEALAELASHAVWSAADLVIANSFTTFWAVHAAKAARQPALFYVHESTTPAAFYGQRVSAAAVAAAEQAFALADAVSFTTAATRRYHLGYGRPERHHLTPGWIDVAALDRWRANQDRDMLRRQLGVAVDETLVCNIGTISDRKGQHTFVRAIDLFRRRHPALARATRFILLGGRQSPFDTMLGEALAELGEQGITIHPETTDYLRYYLAADLFVCSSYEESSPRVVLEAMALGTPILASAVHGIPELVRAGREAALLPAGDTAAWGEELARLVAAPAVGQELARQARFRVAAEFSAKAVLPRHLALASQLARA